MTVRAGGRDAEVGNRPDSTNRAGLGPGGLLLDEWEMTGGQGRGE